MDMTKEATFHIDGETIELWRFGVNDYAANYLNADCSVRGTLSDILKDLDTDGFLDEILKSNG